MRTMMRAVACAVFVALAVAAQAPAEQFPVHTSGELRDRCAREGGKFIPVGSAGGYGCILRDGRLITCCCEGGGIVQCDIGKTENEEVMSRVLVATLALERQLEHASTCPPHHRGGGKSTPISIPRTLNSSGLTPQQCYSRDSGCTQFCGKVTGDLRYECFEICDRMLDRCLETGDWTDSGSLDPGTGEPAGKGDHLTGLLLQALMILADVDGNGTPSPDEIDTLKSKVLEKVESEKRP